MNSPVLDLREDGDRRVRLRREKVELREKLHTIVHTIVLQAGGSGDQRTE